MSWKKGSRSSRSSNERTLTGLASDESSGGGSDLHTTAGRRDRCLGLSDNRGSPRARVGKLTGTTKRAVATRKNIADYLHKYTGAQLRAAGIRPPTDHEALLAAYLNRDAARDPEPQLCACGCGQPVRRGLRGPAAKWHSDACRKRAARNNAGRS
jgi:hypothetical protein